MSGLTAEELSYRARALAQAHPLSRSARRYLDWAVAGQRTSQPLPEIGIWAGAALLCGYCVRQVEEADLGLPTDAHEAESLTLEQLDAAATAIAADVRTGSVDSDRPVPLGHRGAPDDDRLIHVLDHIVATEVANRLDHWRDSVDDEAWRELEEYITWWVVKGYALRVAETHAGAACP
jgi:hypothetical protein